MRRVGQEGQLYWSGDCNMGVKWWNYRLHSHDKKPSGRDLPTMGLVNGLKVEERGIQWRSALV